MGKTYRKEQRQRHRHKNKDRKDNRDNRREQKKMFINEVGDYEFGHRRENCP